MKSKFTVLLLVCLVAASCRWRSGGVRREQQQKYEVIPEGSAAGVSSTINAPGEAPPPAPTYTAMTGTNADTTTAFTLPDLPPGTATTTMTPGTIGGTLPPPTSYPSEAPRPRRTSPPPAAQPQPPPPPPPTDTSAPPQTPPVTDTTRTDTQPPPTDTSTTSTQPPPTPPPR